MNDRLDLPPAPFDLEGHLAPYAAHAAQTRGRIHVEPPSTSRTEFQRDRDRIIHSTAFRRLEYKTQVFVNHEGDLFRTRLTHSLEVAQIARSIARSLRLNEDLVEAISLAHDLGHTPFGHAGQDALNDCMKPYGGFEHNLQSLRVVDELEEKYAAFSGLNLTFESREGILKHCSARNAALQPAKAAKPFAPRKLAVAPVNSKVPRPLGSMTRAASLPARNPAIAHISQTLKYFCAVVSRIGRRTLPPTLNTITSIGPTSASIWLKKPTT